MVPQWFAHTYIMLLIFVHHSVSYGIGADVHIQFILRFFAGRGLRTRTSQITYIGILLFNIASM